MSTTEGRPAMWSGAVATVVGRVDERLTAYIDAQRERFSALDDDLEDLVDTIEVLLTSGGKRLRPTFCAWAFVGAGGDIDDGAVVDAGAALEMLHSFALLHDDVMDGSPTRRGQPTAHVVQARRHEASGWAGDARRYGDAVAVLAGDLAYAWSDELVPSDRPQVAPLWHDLRQELAVGQYLDVLGSAQGAVSAERARRIIRFKSAKYSVERPLHMGAAVAGRLPELAAPLSRVGLPLGDAFQLRDDVLGAFGDEVLTGKPVGDDLREGKPTVLIALARAATGEDGLPGFGAGHLDVDGIERLQGAIVASGALDEVETMITDLTAQALDAVEDLPFDAASRAAMRDLAMAATCRDR